MPATHICHAQDIDEAQAKPKKEKPLLDLKLRDAVLSTPEWVQMNGERQEWMTDLIDHLAICCWYADQHPSRYKTRIPMNIEEFAEKWERLIVGLSTAHDKVERDKWEHAIDEYLTPILSAPVKQIREFFTLLVERTKANKQIPFFVWRSLEVWHEQTVERSKDQGVKTLKVKLAKEIAELVEEDVKRDIGEAVVGALMWRDAGTLKEIKETLIESKKEGDPAKVSTKTRAVGRQSCLFLVVEHKGKEQTVML